MNARLWACVLAGVLVAHLAVLYIIHHFRAMGRPAPVKSEPNFESKTVTFVDPQGRKVREIREFTVVTQLADEAAPKKAAVPAPDALHQR